MVKLGIRFLSLGLAVICVTAGTSFAQELSPPTLQYVLTYQADLLPPQVVAPDRLVWDAPGGWVKAADGSTGKIIEPSGDWMYVLPNGTFKLDVRATVQMDDGALMLVEYTGRLKFTEEGGAKFQNGEVVGEGDWYFIASPTVHTAAEKYAWMNDAVFVNKGVELQGPNQDGKPLYVRYDVYMVVP